MFNFHYLSQKTKCKTTIALRFLKDHPLWLFAMAAIIAILIAVASYLFHVVIKARAIYILNYRENALSIPIIIGNVEESSGRWLATPNLESNLPSAFYTMWPEGKTYTRRWPQVADYRMMYSGKMSTPNGDIVNVAIVCDSLDRVRYTDGVRHSMALKRDMHPVYYDRFYHFYIYDVSEMLWSSLGETRKFQVSLITKDSNPATSVTFKISLDDQSYSVRCSLLPSYDIKCERFFDLYYPLQ